MGLTVLVVLIQLALSSSTYHVPGINHAQIDDKHITSSTEAYNFEHKEFDGRPEYRILEDDVTLASNTTTFFFITEEKTWRNAQEDCQARGGDLASINGATENSEVLNISNGSNYWLGIIDELNVNNFGGSDGIDMSFTNWATG